MDEISTDKMWVKAIIPESQVKITAHGYHDVRYDVDYGDFCGHVEFWGERLETDEEAERRIWKIQSSKERERLDDIAAAKREREEYERLKAKYDG